MVARVSLSVAVVAVVLSFISLPPARAVTIRVPSGQPTIQQAIDLAAPGDTVLVAPGTYSGTGNRGLDFQGRDIVLRSEAGADATIIDCAFEDRGIYLHSGESSAAHIDGFTVTHGQVWGKWPEGAGGAVLCDGASPTIRNCRFIDNSADQGGGLSLSVAGARLEDCLIADNRSYTYGGGIDGGGSLELVRCEIARNACGGDYGTGGGVYFGGSPLIMRDCVLQANVADNYGDDMFTLSRGGGLDASGTVRLTRCEFRENVASGTNDDSFNDAAGGGAYIEGKDAVLEECVFIDNAARSISDPIISLGGNTAYGGGLACSSAVLSSCVFQGNEARSEGNPDGNYSGGGGLYGDDTWAIGCLFIDNSAVADLLADHQAEGGGAATTQGSHFARCTFSGNSATTSGAAIQLRDAGLVTIDNTIIAFSVLSEVVGCADGSTPLLSCCDVYGNTSGDWTGCIAGQANQNGNFSADPLFCDTDNANYRIAVDSPCTPANSPGQCDLVGALPIGCGMVGVSDAGSPPVGPYVRVFPNPLAAGGVLEWNDPAGAAKTVRLYDLAGRLVLSREIAGGARGQQQLPWSELAGAVRLAAGVYFLKLEPLAGHEGAVRVLVTK